MEAITDHALWFVPGLLVGWFSAWLFIVARRAGARMPARPELHAPMPATPQRSPSEDFVEPAHAPPASLVIDVAGARAAGFNMKHADDLSIIEGIGPKIEDLLRANGIGGFAQLAQLHADDLADILERGGPNFRFANPATWAEQATLAAGNHWTELKQLQRGMIGSVAPGGGY